MRALNIHSIRFVFSTLAIFMVVLACGKDPVSTSSGTGPQCLTPPDTIVGWWPLDQLGTAADELVDRNQGDYIGRPLEAAGKVGGALRFDGVDDLVSIPDPGANWVYDITTDLTLEMWIKRDSDQTGQQVLVGKADSYFVGLRGGRIFTLIPTVYDYVATTQVPVGEWYHVAMTWDDSAMTGNIYLNGEVDGSFVSADMGVIAGNSPIYIGGLLGQQYFDGYMDEVGIYASVLSTSEIREIYDRGSLGKCKN